MNNPAQIEINVIYEDKEADFSSQRRMSVTSDDSDKSLKSVSFSDQVLFRSYQPNITIPLERERSIELYGDLDQSVKEISKLVPYKKSNPIAKVFKSIFKSSGKSENNNPQAIVL
ncbi:hypothetical protein K502DRAFT_324076 [Neoconidiobolus thromboides FSU 785]|nr:hypothetical protein K502DRAFT_324076 [Neoconidiobolus thromboides FSU 785]